MQPTSPDTWKPKDNYLLVAVPERFTYAHTPGQKRLVLPSGSDDWQELGRQLAAGENVQIETDEQPIPVRQGVVLAVCERLTDEMMLCEGPFSRLVPHYEPVRVAERGQTRNLIGPDGRPVMRSTGRTVEQNIPRTAADITQRVEVGDTIHFDPYALNDASEVAPGVYLVGYADVIAILATPKLDPWHGELPYGPVPIGGYALLTRVWANDVTDELGEEGGLMKCRKNAAGLVVETAVSPLPGEGVVAWRSAPLRNAPHEVAVGDRVVIDQRHARVETIGGVEYLAVRQDFVIAVREPDEMQVEMNGERYTVGRKRIKQALDFYAAGCPQPPRPNADLMPAAHFLPAHHPAYDA